MSKTFVHRFSSTVSCQVIVSDDPPARGQHHIQDTPRGLTGPLKSVFDHRGAKIPLLITRPEF